MMLQARPTYSVRGLPIILSLITILAATPFMVGSNKALSRLGASLDMGRLPLIFVPNVGQERQRGAEETVSYLAHSAGGTLMFAPSEVVLTAPAGVDGQTPPRTD